MNKLTNMDLRNIQYHQLDIDDTKSISSFAKFIKETHGGLDVLINNAAIAFKVIYFIFLSFKMFKFDK